MNWLITGGCGFIGSSLTLSLFASRLHSNVRLRVFDNFSVGSLTAFADVAHRKFSAGEAQKLPWSDDEVQVVQADILDKTAIENAAYGADVIIHLAANTGVQISLEDPETDCVTNVIGTLNALEAARKNNVSRFVLASSGAAVGEVTPPITEDIIPRPLSPYGASKLSGEAYCSAYFGSFGIEAIGLRFGNVYGPGSHHKSSVVAQFMLAVINNKPLTIYGDGLQTRDFIFIDDLKEAITAAAERPNVGGQIFQIATSTETTVKEIADLVSEIAVESGRPKPELFFSSPRDGDVLRNFSDTSKALKLLNWRAETSLKSGLAQTYEWFSRKVSG